MPKKIFTAIRPAPSEIYRLDIEEVYFSKDRNKFIIILKTTSPGGYHLPLWNIIKASIDLEIPPGSENAEEEFRSITEDFSYGEKLVHAKMTPCALISEKERDLLRVNKVVWACLKDRNENVKAKPKPPFSESQEKPKNNGRFFSKENLAKAALAAAVIAGGALVVAKVAKWKK